MNCIMCAYCDTELAYEVRNQATRPRPEWCVRVAGGVETEEEVVGTG